MADTDSTSSAPADSTPPSAIAEPVTASISRQVLPGAGPALLSSIEHISTANSTTVVLKLNHAARYTAHRLLAPDRIYFDFDQTQVVKELNGIELVVTDPLLRKIRSSQRSTELSRVTVETTAVCDYSVRFSHNPDRMLIELRAPVKR